MPTYEYKCDACGKTFEKFQSITAAPLRKCALCGQAKVHRLISGGAGLLFKGSGFYITDYRSESYKSAAKAETGSPSSAEKSSTASTNTAPSSSSTSAASPAPPASPTPARKK